MVSLCNGDEPVSSEDENDPIVREIPIYHSKKLQDTLFLFQYPQNSQDSSFCSNIKKCSIKPENKEVRLEVELSTESSNFDDVKATEIAKQVDGDPLSRKTNEDIYFENNMVDKLVYTSMQTDNQPQNFAVGTYNGKELHLTTVKAVINLAPNVAYVDKGLQRKKDSEKNEWNEESDDNQEAGPSTSKTQQVTVKCRSNDERWQKIHEKTYHSIMAQSAKEPWIECKWYDQKSAKSSIQRLDLYAENMEDIGQARNLSDAEYFSLLIPEEEQSMSVPALPAHVLSLHALRAQPIPEQCRILLKEAKVIAFQQLLMLLAGVKGVTSETLLKVLPKVAVLVRGNWVVKSEILYPKDTFSRISGVPAELMCRTRDYVLYLFTKSQYVERKKVTSIMKIPSEEMKEILTGISELRQHNGWELRLPLDEDFINKHSELVREQNRKWDEWFVKADLIKAHSEKGDKKRRQKSKSVSEDVKKTMQYNSSDDSGTEKKSPIAARRRKVS